MYPLLLGYIHLKKWQRYINKLAFNKTPVIRRYTSVRLKEKTDWNASKFFFLCKEKQKQSLQDYSYDTELPHIHIENVLVKSFLSFLVSTAVSVKWARWSCLTVWDTLKRPLKNLGWHHQVHILFVEQYALCIVSAENMSQQVKHTHTKVGAHLKTFVCVCVCEQRPQKHKKERKTHRCLKGFKCEWGCG